MFYTRVLLLLVLLKCAYGHKMVKGDKKHYDHNIGITGGHDISIEQVPYMVSLRYNNGELFCGGSIIHKSFILTAAQCVYEEELLMKNTEIKVRVGTDKLNKGGKLYDVEKIIVHEQYNNITGDYDICILKLNETLTFGPTVNKVLLNADIMDLREGTLLNTTGWGTTSPNDIDLSDHLQLVTIPVVSWQYCNWYYPDFTDRMMCAGARKGGKDSCEGDSGGPLIWKNVQVGITYGGDCGEAPGVYTKIFVVEPWIKDKIKNYLKKEKSGQKTNRHKMQDPERENNPITKKFFKRALQ